MGSACPGPRDRSARSGPRARRAPGCRGRRSRPGVGQEVVPSWLVSFRRADEPPEQCAQARRLPERAPESCDLLRSQDHRAPLKAAPMVIVAEPDRERTVLVLEELKRRLMILTEERGLLDDLAPTPVKGKGARHTPPGVLHGLPRPATTHSTGRAPCLANTSSV